jgi:hypothetical protein
MVRQGWSPKSDLNLCGSFSTRASWCELCAREHGRRDENSQLSIITIAIITTTTTIITIITTTITIITIITTTITIINTITTTTTIITVITIITTTITIITIITTIMRAWGQVRLEKVERGQLAPEDSEEAEARAQEIADHQQAHGKQVPRRVQYA